MMKFLKKLFGVQDARPSRGDTRVSYWKNRAAQWNWSCQDGNNQVVCGSTQGYETEAGCLKGIENARDALYNAVVVKREMK